MAVRHLFAGLVVKGLVVKGLVALAIVATSMTEAPAQSTAPAKSAQKSAPAKDAKSDAKSTQKSAPAKAAPAAKSAPAAAAAGGAEPTLAGQFGNWGAYTASPGGRKICFVLAKPSSSKTNPPNRPRDPAYVFVSTRPAEKVKEEVHVMIGYPLKPGSDASLEVGGATFAMYTQGDGVWIKNAAEEERLVEAMRRAGDVVVKGVSSRGTETTDTFSARGLAQALDKAAQSCR